MTGTSPGDAPLDPGVFPYTAGVYPGMYRNKLWTMRQYAGFGSASETNARFRYLLESGQTGLSVAFDLPTQMGLDSDADLALGEVGRVGVAIDTVEDMIRLFRAIPLDQVSTSMTINATAPVLLAFYLAAAREQGASWPVLRGTIQNDVLKEFVARGTYIYPVEPSLRYVTDVFDFCRREVPRWNPVSISGYHMREAGSTAAQEVGFTLANGLEYVNRAVSRGMAVDEFGPRLSFFFSADRDFLEETAKFRAARRMWATLLRERYGASDKACRLRFHTQTAGSALTAQQPLNNVVRVALQAMSAVLGGTQSLHTNGYDEALALPTESSARLALRTQQIIASETGVADWPDPFQGSYVVEALTDRVEEKARACLATVESLGGASRAVEYMRAEIHETSYRFQLSVERGETETVGVNVHSGDESPPTAPAPDDYAAVEATQRDRLASVKATRANPAVDRSLNEIRRTAETDDNLMPAVIEAAQARATVGEISHALRDVWGVYRPGQPASTA